MDAMRRWLTNVCVRTARHAACPLCLAMKNVLRVGLEAATGFEPVIKVLQTSALPLGHAAAATGNYRHPPEIFQSRQAPESVRARPGGAPLTQDKVNQRFARDGRFPCCNRRPFEA